MSRGFNPRLTTALALAAAFLLFLPYFSPRVIPVHDSGQVLNAFHAYFSALVFEHALPLWNPYSAYGTNAANMAVYVSAVSYFVGAVGALVGVKDGLFLFKVAVLLEFLLLVLGTLLFCHRFLKTEWAKGVVLAATLFSFNWAFSLDGNFHAFYYLPFLFIAWHDYFAKRDLYYLLKGGLWATVSFIGNTPYISPLILFISMVFLARFAFQERGVSLKTQKPFWTFAMAAAFVFFAVSFVGFLGLNFTEMQNFSTGRDAETGTVSFSVFRRYGGILYINIWLRHILSGTTYNGDVTFYIGLLPWVLAGYALFQSRERLVQPLKWTAIALFLFSMGGGVSYLAYHLPGMKFYRHISLIHCQLKYIVILLAGFGMDAWLASETRISWVKRIGDTLKSFTWPQWLLFGFVVIEILSPYLYGLPRFACNIRGCSDKQWACWLPFLSRTLLYAGAYLAFRRGPRIRLQKALFGVFLFDVILFQILVHRYTDKIPPEKVAIWSEIYTARPASLPQTREPKEVHAAGVIKELTDLPGRASVYVTSYALAREKPCYPWARTDFLPLGVAKLYRQYRITLADNFTGWNTSPEFYKIVCAPPRHVQNLTPALPATGNSKISYEAFSWNRFRGIVTTAEPGFFFYPDAFHSGWKATVNGVSTPVQEAFGFKAVAVGAGVSTVEFTFFNGWGSIFYYCLFLGSLVWVPLAFVSLARFPNPSEPR